MDRLDNYETKPRDMERYLSTYGWHFSKSMCEWAVSMMKDRNGKPLQFPDKKTIEDQIPGGVEVKGYDAVYVYCMAKADYMGSSIKDEPSIAKFVADYIGDLDGYEGKALTQFMADCCGKGVPIIWSDML